VGRHHRHNSADCQWQRRLFCHLGISQVNSSQTRCLFDQMSHQTENLESTTLSLYLSPTRGAKYWDARACLYICLYVCPRASQKLQGYFLYMLIVAVALFSFDDNAMLCTSGFVDDVMFDHNRPDKGDANRTYTQNDSAGGRTEESLISTIALFFCILLSQNYLRS